MNRLIFILFLSTIVAVAVPAHAQPQAAPAATPLGAGPAPVALQANNITSKASDPKSSNREIYVPFEDLKSILASGTERIFMSREQYSDLLKKANVKPGTLPPQNTALIGASYHIQVDDDHAVVTGKLQVESLAAGVQLLPLPLVGVSIKRVAIGDRSMALVKQGNQPLKLVLDKPGIHQVDLQFELPVKHSAAQQSLGFQLPTTAATTITMTVPGNIELKSGASVLKRRVDEEANVTHFEILPSSSAVNLVMSLNNKRLQADRVIQARNVVVAELAEAFERIHVSTSIKVLHGAVGTLEFQVPAGFEITNVETSLLARWLVTENDMRRVLKVELTETTTKDQLVNITAIRVAPNYDSWTFPTVRPLGVVSSSSVIGILTELTLTVHSLEPTGLLRLDNAVLDNALPESIYVPEPGAPAIRLMNTYYAAQADYSLSAAVIQPQNRFTSLSNLLLTIEPTRQHLQASFSIQPEVDDIYMARIQLSPGWQVLGVTDQANHPAPYHITTEEDGGRFIQVQLNQKIVAGETGSVNVQAIHTPVGWLDEWDEAFATTFPSISLVGAYRNVGMLAVRTAPGYEEVFHIRAGNIEGLTAVSNSEKAKFGLESVRTQLVYRYEQPQYTAPLNVSRIEAIYAARCASFFHVAPGRVACNYEITFEMQRGRTDTLAFALPASTPSDIVITGIGKTKVKRFEATEGEEQRTWQVTLTEMAAADIVLAVYFELPVENEKTRVQLPGIAAQQVSYQTGVISLESSPELQITPLTEARRVDVGELAATSYVVGRRRVGAYGYVGTPPSVEIQISEPDKFTLPRMIVKECNITSYLSKKATVQHLAEFFVDARTDYVEVELPKGSNLWSVTVANQPVRPQRTDKSHTNRFLVDLSKLNASAGSGQPGTQAADLTIVYGSDRTLRHGARLKLFAPRLYRFSRRPDSELKQSQRIPIAKTNWKLVVPSSHGLVGIGQPYEKRANHHYMTRLDGWIKPRHELPLALFFAGGGIRPPQAASSGADTALATRATPSNQWHRSIDSSEGAEAPMDGAGFDDAMENAEMELEDLDLDLAQPKEKAAKTPAPPANPSSEPAPAADKPQQSSAPDPKAEEESRDEQSGGEKDVMDRKDANRDWASRGKRSLRIQLNNNIDTEASHEVYEFNNLSDDAEITGTIVHKSQVTVTGWSIGLLVFALGLLLCGRPAKLQLKFFMVVEIAMILLYFVNPLPTLEEAWIMIAALTATLVPIFIITTVYREWLGHLTRRLSRKAIAPLLIALACLGPQLTSAQEDDAVVAVKVPAGSVIVPYDPAKLPVQSPEQQLMVPLDYYTQLWRRAFPDKPLPHEVAPVSFAIAGAHYETTLVDSEYLLLQGHVDIDVFTSKEVTVPLNLLGAVLQNATLDDKPASLELLKSSADSSKLKPQTQQNAAPEQPAAASLMALHISGKGRHRLTLTIRAQVAQQGGWRIADTRLPTGAATEVRILAPKKKTEIRWQGTHGKSEFTTNEDSQTVISGTASNGQLQFRWRSGVSESKVDRDLTARSSVMVDVQEDGTYVDWNTTFQFRSAQRDLFRLLVPAEYRVENVLGSNVRSWQVREANGNQEISVELLEAATQKVDLKIRLVKYENTISGELTTIRIPRVVIPDSVLHEGTVVIRRSPILNLRPTITNGIVREDVPEAARSIAVESQGRIGPLGLEPVQAYRFSSTGFDLEVETSLIPSTTTARLENVVRISEQDITLETRVRYSTTGRAIHQARVLVPADMIIRAVHAPGLVDWSEVPYDHDGKQVKLVTVLFSTGVTGSFSVVIDGQLERKLENMASSVPHLSALDVTTQNGQTVLLTDPSYSIQLTDIEDAESVPVATMFSWLRSNQRQFARAAVRFTASQYNAAFKITRRPASIRVNTYSNVKMTPRAIEETLLLDYTISNSGIRQLQFQLPNWLKHARIKSPYLREVTVADIADDDNWVDVTVDLEDEVIGQLRVIIEHDRELESLQRIPIPIIKNGNVNQQFIALESTGDEIEIAPNLQGLEEIERNQAEWTQLTKILAGNIYAAYKVLGDASQSTLVYSPVRRAVMDKDNAKILLAETTFFMDRHGSYRTKVVLHVDNQKEQFLAVEIPEGSVLWTVLVAGMPVKPLIDAENRPRHLRIPLIRTELGDNAFTVELVYAGNMPKLDKWNSVDNFPFLATPGNAPSKNHITVNLPRTFHWNPNTGGTLDRVDSKFQRQEQASMWAQRNRSLYSKVKQSKNVNDKIRLQLNFSQQRLENGSAVDEEQYEAIQQDLNEYFKRSDLARDNRKLLNDGFDEQSNIISRNAVNQLGNNFDLPQAIPNPMKDASRTRVQNSQQWLRGNGLEQRKQQDERKQQERASRIQKTNKGKSNINLQKNLPQSLDDTEEAKRDSDENAAANRRRDRTRQQAAQYLEQQQILNLAPAASGQQRGQIPAEGRFSGELLGDAPTNQPVPGRPSTTSPGLQGFGGGGGFGVDGVIPGSDAQATTVASDMDSTVASQGLVSLSLDLDLNSSDYDTFYFSAPGDELELTIRGMEQSFRDKLQLVGFSLAILFGLLISYWIATKVNQRRWLVMVAGIIMALAGLANVAYGFLPIYAAILLVGGLMWAYSGYARKPLATET